MLIGQLSGRRSLRDITDNLKAQHRRRNAAARKGTSCFFAKSCFRQPKRLSAKACILIGSKRADHSPPFFERDKAASLTF
jgi:hypothetical protein